MASVGIGLPRIAVQTMARFNEAEAFVASVVAGHGGLAVAVGSASMRPRLLWPRWDMPLERFGNRLPASMRPRLLWPRWAVHPAGNVRGESLASMRPRLLWPRWQLTLNILRSIEGCFNEAEAFVASVGR